MKNNRRLNWTRCSLIFLAISVFLSPSAAIAWETCANQNTNDKDCDGFIDSIEAPAGAFTSYSGQRYSTIDSKQTLFYIYSDVGTNPQVPQDAASRLAYLMTPHVIDQDVGGLNFEIYEEQFVAGQNDDEADTTNYRRVTPASAQKAILLVEDRVDTWSEGDAIGICEYGNPNFPWVNKGIVYTHKMRGLIDSECGAGYGDSQNPSPVTCKSKESGASSGPALLRELALHTYAHEAAHMSRPLAFVTDKEYQRYGYHTPTGEGFIMDVSVETKYSNKDKLTYFYIYNDFRWVDYDNVRLVYP